MIPIPVQIFKYSYKRLFDVFKKQKIEYELKSEDDSDEDPEPYSTYVNQVIHSLFPIVKFTLTKHWFTTSIAYILLEHEYTAFIFLTANLDTAGQGTL